MRTLHTNLERVDMGKGNRRRHKPEAPQSGTTAGEVSLSLEQLLSNLLTPGGDMADKFADFNREISAELAKREKPRPKKTVKLARDLLHDAEADAKAARILEAEGIVALSVYHLQQSVEKATKAYALALGVLKPSDLMKIGHKSPLAFISMLRTRLSASYLELFSVFESDIDMKIDAAESAIKESQAELARMSKKRIGELMELNRVSRDVLSQQVPMVLDAMQPVLEMTLPKEQVAEGLEAFRMRFDLDIICHFGALYVLSAITYPHFASTRYSDGEIRPSNYTRHLGIVACEFELLDQTEAAIDALLSKLSETPTQAPTQDTKKRKTGLAR